MNNNLENGHSAIRFGPSRHFYKQAMRFAHGMIVLVVVVAAAANKSLSKQRPEFI